MRYKSKPCIETDPLRPSVLDLVSATELLVGFSWNYVWEFVTKKFSSKGAFHENRLGSRRLRKGVNEFLAALPVFSDRLGWSAV